MKPGCCFPQTFCIRTLAIIDFIVSSAGVVVSAGALIYLYLFPTEVDILLRSPPPQLEPFINIRKLWVDYGTQFVTGLIITGLVYSLQKLGLACLLIIGTFQERLKLIRMWIVYTLIVLVLSVVVYLVLLMMGVTEPLSIPFYVVTFLAREYIIWTMYSFLQKLQAENLSLYLIPRNRVVCKL